jgi:small subunit ribosomal protein S3
MGQKVNPVAYRLPIFPTEMWKSRWFTTNPKRYQEYLMADTLIRQALMNKLAGASVAEIEIERSLKSMRVIIYVTRPGVVIGRGGSGLEDLKKYLYGLLQYSGKEKTAPRIDLQVEEIKEPDLNAYLVAVRIADQLAKRLPARRVVKKTMERTMQAKALGIKVLLAGRVGGAEISRKELYQTGSVPLQTLRANVDYAQVPSLTRSGYIGVKVWIHKGDNPNPA